MHWDARVAFAILSGLGFALLGVAYRIAQLHGRSATQIVLLVCGFGTAFFALQTNWGLLPEMPLRVAITAVASGLSQYVAMTLVVIALRTGPFAPTWCAISLFFVPVLFYGRYVIGDQILPLQYVSLAAAVAAVICSAGAPREADHPASRSAPTRPVIYGILLLAILIGNGLASVAVKELAVRPAGDSNLMQLYAAPYFTLFYLALGLGVLAEQAIGGGLRSLDRMSVGLGILGGVGSLGGFAAQARFADGQPVLFTLSGAVTLLGAALVSVAFFREKITRRWAVTVTLTLVAIVCATAPSPSGPARQAHERPGPASIAGLE